MGRFLGGVCGQLVLSSDALNLHDLNYITLAGVTVSLIVSFFLPTVKKSIYFDPRFSVISTFSGESWGANHERGGVQSDPNPNSNSNGGVPHLAASLSVRKMAVALPKPKQVGFKKRIKRASRALFRDFKIAYTNKYVIKWSLWWSIAQAIYLQVGIYAEPLWKEIEEETHESIYNGVIDASHALLSELAIYLYAYLDN